MAKSFTLAHPRLEVTLSELGAKITSVRAPDRSGALGEVTVDDGLPFAGVTVGRVANRIRDARYGDVQLPVSPGFEPHHIHGGPGGFGTRVWAGEQSADGLGITLRLHSPDGDQGYPGALDVTAEYRISGDGDALVMTFSATATGAPTPVSLCNHAYWDLGGDMRLRVEADGVLEKDDSDAVTGVVERAPGADEDVYQRGLDRTFVGRQPRATLFSQSSGRVMTVRTSQPAMQVYVQPERGALCLETHGYTDAVNHPHFPSVMAHPGGPPVTHETVHSFRTEPLYFNYAGCSRLLPAARAAAEAALDEREQPWRMRGGDAEPVRALFARLVGAQPDDIAIMASTAYGVQTVARALAPSIGPDSVVVLLADQMTSSVMPWQRLPCPLRLVSRAPDADLTDGVLAALADGGANVAAVVLPPCHWTDGALVDLDRVAERCREIGAPLVVDATQAAGVLPLDVASLRPFALMATTHKWLCGAHGATLFYASPELVAMEGARGLEEHERNRAGVLDPSWDAAGCMTAAGYPEEFQPGARRFDMGGHPSPLHWPVVEQGLRTVLDEWTPAGVRAHTQPLVDRIREGAQRLGFAVPARGAPHFVGLHPGPARPGTGSQTAEELVAALRERGVIVAARGSAVRVSVHMATTVEEVELLLEELGRLVAQVAQVAQ